MQRPFIIAHRGYSTKYRPNSIDAIIAAFENGADACEVDVQITKDGEPVLFHDYKLRDTSISDLAYRELK